MFLAELRVFNPYPGKEGPTDPTAFISGYNTRTKYPSAVNFYDFVRTNK